jgi:hypothetical protein
VKRRRKLLLIGTSMASALALFALLRPWAGERQPLEAAGPRSPTSESDDRTLRIDEPRIEALIAVERAPVAAPAQVVEPDASRAEASLVPRRVRGRVFDLEGRPAAGVQVRFEAFSGESDPTRARHEARSDTLGGFDLELHAREGTLREADADWVTVLEARVDEPDPVDGYVLVVAPQATLEGRVLDETKAPIAGARVRFERPGVQYLEFDGGEGGLRFSSLMLLRDPLRATLQADLDRSEAVSWVTQTDGDGVFRFDGVPRVDGARVVAKKEGHQENARAVGEPGSELVLVLRRSEQVPGRLRGRVVDARGDPVRDARVFLEPHEAHSDADGRFDLDLSNVRGTTLVAVQSGGGTARLDCARASADEPGAWPQPLVLELGEGRPVFRGRVIGPDGEPRQDVEVRALAPTTWGEVLARVGASFDAGSERATQTVADDGVHSQADGRFLLPAVLDVPRRLRLVDTATLEVLETEPLEPDGREFVLRLGAPLVRYAGRVVDPRGVPLPGARVHLRRTLPAPNGRGTTGLTLASVSTDAEGRFVFERAAADLDGAQVELGSGLAAQDVVIDPAADRHALVFVVGRAGRFQVDLERDRDAIDGLRVLDAEGRALGMGTSLGAGGWFGSHHWRLTRGRSEPITVPELAVTLVFTRGGAEHSRVPLRIVPGELTVVR